MTLYLHCGDSGCDFCVCVVDPEAVLNLVGHLADVHDVHVDLDRLTVAEVLD